jgi:hypothetical protein
MSTPFFLQQSSAASRQTSLLWHAAKWKDTPWRANSASKGIGVSCHNLPREIFIGCGAFPADFPKIEGTPNDASAKNIMEPFLDARKELVRLNEGERLQAGDLIGLWLVRDAQGNRCRTRHVNHLGVVLGGGWFVHVLMHKRTDFDLHNVSPWLERIVAAWRPVE